MFREESTTRPHPDLSLRSGRPSPIWGEMPVGQRGTDEKSPNKKLGGSLFPRNVSILVVTGIPDKRTRVVIQWEIAMRFLDLRR